MKNKLVIMGTHPLGRELFDWTRTDCDVWMFNEAPTAKKENGDPLFPKVDAVFQLHHEAIWKNPKNRNDEEHFKWLTSGETPTVYMQNNFKEVPKSVKYPLESVSKLLKKLTMVSRGLKKNVKYFSSTPDYALALVAEMWKKGKKYTSVEIYGIELEMESEYQYQRTGFGFWIGYLTALGIEITLYNSIFDSPMYGYEGDFAISADEINKRIKDLKAELGNDKDIYTSHANKLLESISGLLKRDISSEIVTELNDLTKKSERAGILNGKIKESQRYLEKAIAMENASGASVFALGEFDGNRIAFNKQYLEVRQEALLLNANIDQLLKKVLNLKKGSHKRQRALDEFGNKVAELMNKNMLLLHVAGAIEENKYYVDSLKLSIRSIGGEK